MRNAALGVIVGNRDIFPVEVAREGREQILALLAAQGIKTVALSPSQSPYGLLTTWKDAKVCAKLFRDNAASLDGILVTLPNFGDERAVADAIRLSALSVPVFVHAWTDKLGDLSVEVRRDSFCGKLSVCNNLRQYAVLFSIGNKHTMDPRSDQFASELRWFTGVCRVVRGLKSARIGSIGERTTPFKTMRCSEKLLEASGISVESKSLIETVVEIDRLSDTDPRVDAKLKSLTAYLPSTQDVPATAMTTTAKLGVVLERWAQEYQINSYAIQCWSAMQEALKIFPCSIMSMMSDDFLPSACEVDVMGAIAMYAMQLAGDGPSALFDWNNNYGEDDDKLVLFHCSNTALSFLKDANIGFNTLAVKSNPQDSCFCTLHGKLKPGQVGWARLTTDDLNRRIVGCIGDGEITSDALTTFGTTGVMKMPNLQKLLYFLAANGFEHHVALNYSPRTDVLHEALSKYMGWKIYHHNSEDQMFFQEW